MMPVRPLHLNFGPEGSRVTRLGLTVCLCGCALFLYAAHQLADAYGLRQAEQLQQDDVTGRIERMHSQGAVSGKLSPLELARARNAHAVAGQLQTPWANLLEVLEAAPMEHIALLSVEPMAARQQLRVLAEASDLPTMLDYLAYLQRQPALREAMLSSHQVQRQVSGTPVRFQIQAQWVQK